MSYHLIQSALNASVVALVEQVLPAPLTIRWPNRDFSAPDGQPFITVDKLPAGIGPVTFGPTGEDAHRGVLQLGVWVPGGSGEGVLNEDFLAPILKFYTIGAVMRYRGVAPEVEALSTTDPVLTNGRWMAFVSVQWRARVQRDLPGSQLLLSSLDTLVP